ncbi:hypothetical protein [Thalassotalea agarivorans]|uniref:LETM1-like protein n=1 Tax=Thalassotalea agarivorans TaxID=349064 RepID=A0A1I0E4V6_THASX|nr:hypothetical protein [Thalassotalea agarivorans]SET39397.1 hypothetical protein SAMN05660429_01709 [Thalassotalea agarivorans]
MQVWRKFFKAPLRVTLIVRKRNTLKLRRQMLLIKMALAQEKHETKAMLHTYAKYTRGAANKSEMKEANQQLVDLLKGLGIGVFAVLPFAPITIPVVIKLGRVVGVEILPSAFSELKEVRDKKTIADKQSPDQ